MRNSVAAQVDGTAAMRPYGQDFGLYAPDGARKYLNHAERKRFLSATAKLEPDEALFCLTLAWSGARVSEILNLTAPSVIVEGVVIAIQTLKRRKHHVREVPIPPELMTALDRHFRLAVIQRDPQCSDHRLWPWHRVTAWRLVKRVMRAAGLSGARACPKGLRHAFGVATLGIVPLNIRQKWMGHARPETTDIYSDVCGAEEIAFARQYWRRCRA